MFFKEWGAYGEVPLEYSHGDDWEGLLRQGIGLLEQFGRDNRIRVRQWKTTSARYPDQPDGLTSLDLQLVCYSWITGISNVAIVAFVRKRVPGIQYLMASITDDQRQEFGQVVDATVGQIETARFLPRPGIRFPQNGCVSCAHLGLCLGNEAAVGTKLIRQPGASDLDWLDVLDD